MDQCLKYMTYHDCYNIISPYIRLQEELFRLQNMSINIMTQTTNDWTL